MSGKFTLIGKFACFGIQPTKRCLTFLAGATR
jgi:hypothetical protein